jgi:signal transduction histidine kinase
MSQRARILWVIVLAILPLVVLSGAGLWQQIRHEESRIAAERLQLAQAAAFATAAFLEGQVATAAAIAVHPTIARARQPSRELDAFARKIAGEHPEWEGVGVIGPDGNSITASLSGASSYFGDRAYFRQAVQTGKPVVSAALIGRRSGKTTVVIAVPIEPAPGQRGVMVAPLPTDRFGAGLMAKIGARSVALTVIDAEGQAFIRPDPDGLTSLKRLSGPEVEAVLAGRAGTSITGGAETLVAYAPVADFGWGVLLSEPTASIFAPARVDALERAAVLAVILGVVFGLGWILAGRLAQSFARAEHLSAELQRAIETRDEFLAAAAHDLRNPLATIQAAGEVLERAAERPGSVAREQLARVSEHILAASRRMSRLLNGFLDVAHLQIGRPLQLERGRADFAALVRQAVSEQQQLTSRHRIGFLGPDALMVNIDGLRMQRAVENLIGNAVKYSPDGGEVSVRMHARPPEVLLSVEDRGIGIPPADLERVFARFERGANVAGRFSGTGIGLAIARQIVEQHGGSLTVQSAVGEGSTFTLHFPFLCETEASNPHEPPCPTPSSST